MASDCSAASTDVDVAGCRDSCCKNWNIRAGATSDTANTPTCSHDDDDDDVVAAVVVVLLLLLQVEVNHDHNSDNECSGSIHTFDDDDSVSMVDWSTSTITIVTSPAGVAAAVAGAEPTALESSDGDDWLLLSLGGYRPRRCSTPVRNEAITRRSGTGVSIDTIHSNMILYKAKSMTWWCVSCGCNCCK